MVMQRPLKPNGAAVLILGGGGYRRISIAKESEPTANWLLDYGVTTFILYYRLPNDGWARSAPFQDAQRAMRLIRARAESLGLDESQIGIIGYSAGGHCAGMTSVHPNANLYEPVDRMDTYAARPDFSGLIYPVLTMLPPNRTKVSTLTLLGPTPTEKESIGMSVDLQVTDDAPTTFLAHATDDPIAPRREQLADVRRVASGSRACRDARVPLRRPWLQSRQARDGGPCLARAFSRLGPASPRASEPPWPHASVRIPRPPPHPSPGRYRSKTPFGSPL